MDAGYSTIDAIGIPTTLPILPLSEVDLEDIPIGRGGYGTVYRGKHKDLGTVAVKTLVEQGLLPQKHTKILKKEANKLLQICHENSSILKILGLIIEKDNYSLILEYMALGSLLEFRKEFKVQWPLMVRCTWDVISGMDFLHSLDPIVLHLDLKADNILLNGELRAKIADFGLSEWRTATMTVTRSTDTTGRRCTVSHVPPEVWSNVNLPANSQYDVFSFGILIWEMITGGVPYGKSADDLVRSSVLSGQRPDVFHISKECPTELTEMMTKCWHQKATQRPTFSDLKKEIDKLYEQKFQKGIIKSLKNIRAEIVEDYETDDPVYTETAALDDLPESVEMEVAAEPATQSEPTPGSSETSSSSRQTSSSSFKDIKDSDDESEEESVTDTPLDVKFYRTFTDMTSDEKQICRILHNPIVMRMAKTKTIRDIFNVSKDVQKVLTNPKKIERFIAQDLALKWELKYFKYDIYHELSGIDLDSKERVAKSYIELYADDIDRQYWGRETQSDSYYYRRNPDEEKPEREKRKKRIEDIMYRNHLYKNSKSEGNMYRVKKALENASQLRQALKDREEGGGSSLRLSTIDPEVLDLCKDPFLLIPCLYSHDSVLSILAGSYKDVFLKLVSNAKATGSHRHSSRPSMMRMHDMPHHRERDMMRMEEMMMMTMDMDRYGPRGRMRSMYDGDDDDRMRMHRMDQFREMKEYMRHRDREESRMSKQKPQMSSYSNKPKNTSSVTSSGMSSNQSISSTMTSSAANKSTGTSSATGSNTSSAANKSTGTSSATGSNTSTTNSESSASSSSSTATTSTASTTESVAASTSSTSQVSTTPAVSTTVKSSNTSSSSSPSSGSGIFGSIKNMMFGNSKEKDSMSSQKKSMEGMHKMRDMEKQRKAMKGMDAMREMDRQRKSMMEMDRMRDMDRQRKSMMDMNRMNDMEKQRRSMMEIDRMRDMQKQQRAMMDMDRMRMPEMPDFRGPGDIMEPMMMKPSMNISSMKSKPASVMSKMTNISNMGPSSTVKPNNPTSMVSPASTVTSDSVKSSDLDVDAGPTCPTTDSMPTSTVSGKQSTTSQQNPPSAQPMEVDNTPSTSSTAPSGAGITDNPPVPVSTTSSDETLEKHSLGTSSNKEMASSEQQVRPHPRPPSSNTTPPPSEAKKQKHSDQSLEADTLPRQEQKSTVTSASEAADGANIHTLQHQHGDGSLTSIQWSDQSNANFQIGSHNKMVINNPGTGKIRKKRKDRIKVDESEISTSMEEISDKHVDIVASKIDEDWKYLAWELETPKAKLQQIEMDYKADGIYEMSYQALKDWHQRIGEVATIGHLAHILHKLDRDDIAILIKAGH